MKSPLRDLARQIEDVARAHPAYSQAHEVVRVLTGYLLAMARIEELNADSGRLAPGSVEAGARCGLCGGPMSEGEEMFMYHGYSGPCPQKEKPTC